MNAVQLDNRFTIRFIANEPYLYWKEINLGRIELDDGSLLNALLDQLGANFKSEEEPSS